MVVCKLRRNRSTLWVRPSVHPPVPPPPKRPTGGRKGETGSLATEALAVTAYVTAAAAAVEPIPALQLLSPLGMKEARSDLACTGHHEEDGGGGAFTSVKICEIALYYIFIYAMGWYHIYRDHIYLVPTGRQYVPGICIVCKCIEKIVR